MTEEDWLRRAQREQSKAHPLAKDVIDAMLSQLVIVLVERLGGEVTVPVAEIDGTGDRNLALRFDADAKTFTFVNQRKS